MNNPSSPESTEQDLCFEALEVTTRNLSAHYTRAEFVEQVHDLESPRVLRTIFGIPLDPPMSLLEDHLAATAVQYEVSPGNVVRLLEALRQEVLNGQLFEEKPDSKSYPVNY